MSLRFAGKTAIVTGGSRGIGLAIARRLVDDGARVVVTGRRQDALDEAVDHLGGADHADAVAGEADDASHQAHTVDRAIEVFGSLDLLVNNAGINTARGPLMEIDLDALQKMLDVNAFAALEWAVRAYDAWMRTHGGAVVNISSIGALGHKPGKGPYGLSKTMLAYLTAQLAIELGPTVRVNAVAPAIVKTRFAAKMYEGREEEMAAPYPLKRLGIPWDIGGVVAFLLSDEAGWVTGHHMVVDGGLTVLGTVGAEPGRPVAAAAPARAERGQV
ncbi:MAG TPA: SDR family oxidoreductase [Mycobacteriales bacterium]|nr:SDR family oxidoreductase [Mycobacteriales bacterium]